MAGTLGSPAIAAQELWVCRFEVSSQNVDAWWVCSDIPYIQSHEAAGDMN